MLPTIAFYSFFNDGILFGKVNNLSIWAALLIGSFAAVKYGIETWHKTKKKKFWKNH
jgi:lipoprotein signal peptidase